MFEGIKKRLGTFIGNDTVQYLEEQHTLPREEGYNQTMELATSSHEGSTFKYRLGSPGRTSEEVTIGTPGGLSNPTTISYVKRKPRG